MNHYKRLDLELDTRDWRFLNYLHTTYITQVKPYVTPKGTFDQFKDFFLRDADKDYRGEPIFAKIADLFTDGNHSDPEYVYRYSQVSLVEGNLVPHRDTRTCVISVPMVPLSPVYWYTNLTGTDERLLLDPLQYMEIDSYDYSDTAALVNTIEYHGVPYNTSPRIFFQVGGFSEDFTEVVKKLKQ